MVDEWKWLPFGIDQLRCSSLKKLQSLFFGSLTLRFESEQNKLIHQRELFAAIFTSVGEQGPVTAGEIRLVCLLWTFAIQHR